MRTDLAISSPFDSGGALPARPKVSHPAPVEQIIPGKDKGAREPERRAVRAESHVYQKSPVFDINGQFLPPLAFGMTMYESVRKSTARKAMKGAYLSVYT